MIKKLLFASVLALSLSLSPLVGTAHATTSLWVRITSVVAFNDGSTQVFVNNTLPTSCSEKFSFRVVNEAMTRQVVASLLSKREVRVNTSNACTSGLDNVTWIQTR